jgi:hypothetical protein
MQLFSFNSRKHPNNINMVPMFGLMNYFKTIFKPYMIPLYVWQLYLLFVKGFLALIASFVDYWLNKGAKWSLNAIFTD